MEELEDEPPDVQNATPVEDEIRRGEIDEFIKNARLTKLLKLKKPEPFCEKPEKEPLIIESCPEEKKKKEELPKTTQFCIEPPYKRVKQDLVPRHCMTRNKHLDVLATPKYIRKTGEEEQEPIRRIRKLYPRTEWLSKPHKRRVLMTLVQQSQTLPAKFVDHLIQVLEGETAISPEQAEYLIRHKRNQRKKGKKKKSKCGEKIEPPMEPLGGDDPSLDLEVAQCQYTMAQQFVRSILNWKCSYPREDYSDIAEVILQRLSEQLEYTPIGNEDRKSEQMRILADVFGCWISEIIMKVAEKYGPELEKEADEEMKRCESKKQESESDDDHFTDEEDGYPKYLEAHCSPEQRESCTQVDDEDEEEVEEDGESEASSDACIDEEQQTEPKPKIDCSTITHTKQVVMDECIQANVKCTEEKELEQIYSHLSNAFQTDVPFITFAKIMDTLYCMIESEPANDMCCQVDNRIHRAIYEKFQEVMCQEDPNLLDARMKDVLNVVTGKLASWLSKALNTKQIKFFEQYPAEVESQEIRDWAKWMEDTVNVADAWSNWIHKVTNEAQCIKNTGGITRGDWKDWTGKFETNAMLFRRHYLETVHNEHHNTMMYTDRNVLKSCTKKNPEFDETMIKNINYESCLRHK